MSGLASFVVSRNDDVVVGSLSGEIDLSNAMELERAIVDAVPNTTLGMVLDLSELTYLDSSGIRLLLSLAGRLRWRGQDLALAAPDGSRCRRVLSMAGIDGSVILERTVDTARRRLLGPG
jgi:anti-anti-sigma factor